MAVVDYGVYGDVITWSGYIAGTTGRFPATREVIRVNNFWIGPDWEVILDDGPYLIYWYRLSTNQATLTTTLNIEIDDVLAYSASCRYVDNVGPNWEFLIGGNIFTTDAGAADYNKSAPAMVAQQKIRLFGLDRQQIDYQVIKFELGDIQ